MYDNIGKKIKGLAIGTFVVEAIGFVVGGLYTAADYDEVYILMALIGPIVAWVSSWLLYGFGELIDKTSDIAACMRGEAKKSQVQINEDNERINKLEKLRAEGLITEEEYQEALNK